ncbi:UNVERIFIED_CONTAM: hypothetical protein K2H54_053359 [Gekko kuhli]
MHRARDANLKNVMVEKDVSPPSHPPGQAGVWKENRVICSRSSTTNCMFVGEHSLTPKNNLLHGISFLEGTPTQAWEKKILCNHGMPSLGCNHCQSAFDLIQVGCCVGLK